MSMFFVIFAFFFLYLGWRWIYPLKIRPAGKVLLAIGLLLICAKFPLSQYVFGGLAAPHLPRAVLMVYGWLFGSVLLLFILTLIKDALLLLARLAEKISGRALGFSAAIGRRAFLLIPLVFILGAAGVWQAVKTPEVKNTEVFLPQLPPELDGLTIVQLTDLHVSELLPAAWLKAVADKTNALEPDLILLTGDLIDGSVARRFGDVGALLGLKARYGVLACLGNHEYISGLEPWVEAYGRLGLSLLRNEGRLLNIRGREIFVGAVTDPAAGSPRFRRPGQDAPAGPDIAAALRGAPPEAFKILMAHQPKLARQNAAAGVDLQLSGHTHGAQILGFGLLGAPANGGFVRGWYEVGPMKLYVSNGSGLWNGFPMRLGVHSEITRLTLRAR